MPQPKSGLIGMVKVWALELGVHGITANAVGPGPIRTELFDHANPPESPRTQAIIDAIPVRRSACLMTSPTRSRSCSIRAVGSLPARPSMYAAA